MLTQFILKKHSFLNGAPASQHWQGRTLTSPFLPRQAEHALTWGAFCETPLSRLYLPPSAPTGADVTPLILSHEAFPGKHPACPEQSLEVRRLSQTSCLHHPITAGPAVSSRSRSWGKLYPCSWLCSPCSNTKVTPETRCTCTNMPAAPADAHTRGHACTAPISYSSRVSFSPSSAL